VLLRSPSCIGTPAIHIRTRKKKKKKEKEKEKKSLQKYSAFI
jgi:hypothetical protein